MIISMEILDDFSTDQVIVKGKRTKRLRPSSSASSSGGVRNGGGGEFSYNSLGSISPASSSSGISTSTEEDEDMANCLILLARGGFSPSEKAIKPPENKFGSRKFMEMATMTDGKVGIYLYECKTCSRTFPSFQALGGHRASHKKPKTAADVDQKKSPPAAAAAPNDEEGKFNKLNTVNPSASTQLPIVNVENKPKVHECSICGSEFASGQALGGHMRRHRSAINPRSGDGTSSLDVSEKSRNILELDLNLPAPPEDDGRETEFHEFSSNQQPRLVFSAAALVDCHY